MATPLHLKLLMRFVGEKEEYLQFSSGDVNTLWSVVS